MPSPGPETRTLKVDYLTRVEGEASLRLELRDGVVEDVQLAIFEPPRFFEALLRGRQAAEAPDITARICGICPVAYQMSAVHALERAFGVTVTPEIRALRRLLYCGEWIESHALHIHMLAAPDFLGCDSVIALAEMDPAAVQRGLRLKRVGNAILELLGGRAVHPVSVRLGGFTRVPTRTELAALRQPLAEAYEDALACLAWTAQLKLPTLSIDTEFVALRHADEYPFNEGHLVSSRGLDVEQTRFAEHFHEQQVPYSHALQSRTSDGRAYFVGPLARLNLNFDRLDDAVVRATRAAGVEFPNRNPYTSIVARAAELLQSVVEARRLVDAYVPPVPAHVDVVARAGSGCAVTEAPRGILYHRYETDADGRIVAATIVPPTSQNQAQMEDDLRKLGPSLVGRSDEEATRLCETALRNYDPCISCATHFLRLELIRR